MEHSKDLDHSYRSWPVLGIFFVLVVLLGCSQSGSKTAAATASNKCSPKKATTSQSSGTKKTSSSKKASDEAELTDEDGLTLLAEPNYKDDIAPTLKAKCATPGCHVPGGAPTPLHTYAAVTAGTAIADSIERMKATTNLVMPPKPAAAMESAFITTFETWGKGKPPKESAALTSTKGGDEEDTGKSTSKKTTKVTKKGSEDAEAEEEYVCVKKSQVKDEDEETDEEADAKTSKSGSANKTSKSKASTADDEE